MFKRIALFVGGAILSCGVAFAQTSVTGKVVASEDRNSDKSRKKARLCSNLIGLCKYRQELLTQ